MAFTQDSLKTRIMGLFQKQAPENTMPFFAANFATEYEAHCKEAVTFNGDGLVTTGRDDLETDLLELEKDDNTGPIVGGIIEDAIVKFWNNSVFTKGTPPGFGGVDDIIITPMDPGSILPGLIAAILLEGDAADAAGNWATAIHTATLGVKTNYKGTDPNGVDKQKEGPLS